MSVWGCDISTRRVAFGIWPDRATYSLKLGGDGTERLSQARALLHAELPKLAMKHPPLCVWIEAPAGKYLKPSLIRMCGVVECAIFDALGALYRYPVPVYLVGPGQWRKHALGSGRASKADVMLWAMTEGQWGCDPANQDEAEALAIAAAGYRMVDGAKEHDEHIAQTA